MIRRLEESSGNVLGWEVTGKVSEDAATVRTTCEVGAPAHPTSLISGTGAVGRVGVVSVFACGSGCESLCGVESFCGVFPRPYP